MAPIKQITQMNYQRNLLNLHNLREMSIRMLNTCSIALFIFKTYFYTCSLLYRH